MNLAATIEIYGGGPGSGCDPAVAEAHGTQCGRIGLSMDDAKKALGMPTNVEYDSYVNGAVRTLAQAGYKYDESAGTLSPHFLKTGGLYPVVVLKPKGFKMISTTGVITDAPYSQMEDRLNPKDVDVKLNMPTNVWGRLNYGQKNAASILADAGYELESGSGPVFTFIGTLTDSMYYKVYMNGSIAKMLSGHGPEGDFKWKVTTVENSDIGKYVYEKKGEVKEPSEVEPGAKPSILQMTSIEEMVKQMNEGFRDDYIGPDANYKSTAVQDFIKTITDWKQGDQKVQRDKTIDFFNGKSRELDKDAKLLVDTIQSAPKVDYPLERGMSLASYSTNRSMKRGPDVTAFEAFVKDWEEYSKEPYVVLAPMGYSKGHSAMGGNVIVHMARGAQALNVTDVDGFAGEREHITAGMFKVLKTKMMKDGRFHIYLKQLGTYNARLEDPISMVEHPTREDYSMLVNHPKKIAASKDLVLSRIAIQGFSRKDIDPRLVVDMDEDVIKTYPHSTGDVKASGTSDGSKKAWYAVHLPGDGTNVGFKISTPRLEKFYQEFGFKTKSRDSKGRAQMVRKPQ